MEEIWKDVVGFEGYYEVSNLGRVRSVDRTIMRVNGVPLNLTGKILPQYEKCGNSTIPRLYVNLNKNSEKYVKLVSRLVAIAFIPNPDNLPQVNHLDENPSNNRVDNLEWCTNSYNHNYGTRNVRQAEKLRIKVNVYDLDMNILSTHDSLKEAAELYGCDPSAVTKVCKGKFKQCNNLIFRYADQQPSL